MPSVWQGIQTQLQHRETRGGSQKESTLLGGFMKVRKAVCPRCFRLKKMTSHHIYVKRYYRNNPYIIRLCRNCHDDIEAILKSKEIDRGGQLKDWEYMDITRQFIREVFCV